MRVRAGDIEVGMVLTGGLSETAVVESVKYVDGAASGTLVCLKFTDGQVNGFGSEQWVYLAPTIGEAVGQ